MALEIYQDKSATTLQGSRPYIGWMRGTLVNDNSILIPL